MEKTLKQRKPTRLLGYDYSTSDSYFLTICTEGMKCILSTISMDEMENQVINTLTPLGKIVEAEIQALKSRYPVIDVENYVIMPNHIHLLITIVNEAGGASPSPTVSDIICTLKSRSQIRITKECGKKNIFQRSFYDHIIRNHNDWSETWDYIDGNPITWIHDKHYIN